MNRSSEEFMHRQNVINFTRQLAVSEDGQQRLMLMHLLAQERARAAASGWSPLIA
jgi:hypothetical protein